MTRGKTLDPLPHNQGLVTAVDRFAGGKRVPYDPENSARHSRAGAPSGRPDLSWGPSDHQQSPGPPRRSDPRHRGSTPRRHARDGQTMTRPISVKGVTP